MTVDLSRWTKSFALSSGNGSTNFLTHLASSTNPSKAFGQMYPVPNVPAANYGNTGAKMVIVAIGFDLGGYGAPGYFRFKIWDGSGVSKYTSDELNVWASSTSTINVPRFTLNIVDGSSDDINGTVETSVPPILTTNSTQGGTTNYRFGAYISAGSDIGYQLQTNTSYEVNQDLSITTLGTFNIDATQVDKSLIGRVYYIVNPSDPGKPVEDSYIPKARQVGLQWTAPTDTGGDRDYFFVIDYQKVGLTSWIRAGVSGTTSTSETITNLENGASYIFRIRALNFASLVIPNDSNGDQPGSNWVYSDVISTTPLPTWNDQTIVSSAEAYKAFSDGVSSNNADSYAVTSGALPPGLSLNTYTGTVIGTPISMGTYTFTIQASNVAGTISKSFTLTITGSVNVMNSSGNPISGTVKVYDGSGWVPGTIYVWDLTYTGTGGTHWRLIK